MLVVDLGAETSGFDEADLQSAAGLAEASEHRRSGNLSCSSRFHKFRCHYAPAPIGPGVYPGSGAMCTAARFAEGEVDGAFMDAASRRRVL
jgi:hypothetical protein